MNRASLVAPEDAATRIATHHENRRVLPFVPIDRVLGDHLEHLAIFVAQGTDGMDVTAAQAVSNAVEPRARTHE